MRPHVNMSTSRRHVNHHVDMSTLVRACDLLKLPSFMRARVFRSLYCHKEKLGATRSPEKVKKMFHLLELLVNHEIADDCTNLDLHAL